MWINMVGAQPFVYHIYNKTKQQLNFYMDIRDHMTVVGVLVGACTFASPLPPHYRHVTFHRISSPLGQVPFTSPLH